MIDGLADYIAENYGCCIAPLCRCRADGIWLGRACMNWSPAKAVSFEQLAIEQRAEVA